MIEEDTAIKIEQIKVQLEALKHQYDYFKNMTALNTGAFIIVVAFMEKVFENPIYKVLILFSLASFSISLLFSLKVMKNYNLIMTTLWGWNFKTYSDKVLDAFDELGDVLIKQRLWCSRSFFSGIVFLFLFAGANYLSEQPFWKDIFLLIEKGGEVMFTANLISAISIFIALLGIVFNAFYIPPYPGVAKVGKDEDTPKYRFREKYGKVASYFIAVGACGQLVSIILLILN